MRGCGRIAAARIADGITVHDGARDESTDEIAQTIGHEIDQPLRGGAYGFTGTLIGVHLSADEKEVITYAVQQDARIDQPIAPPGLPLANAK